MATISYSITKQQQKKDGTFRIRFRITQKRQSSYLSTEYYVNENQLTSDLKIKPRSFIYRRVMNDLELIREEFNCHTKKYASLDVKDIAEKIKIFLRRGTTEEISFMGIMDEYIALKEVTGKFGTINNYKHFKKRITEFLKNKDIDINTISSNTVKEFETFVRNRPKEMGLKREVNNSGVIMYMTMFKAIINYAKKKYNNFDTGEILVVCDPFKRYTMPIRGLPSKKSLPLEELRRVLNYTVTHRSRELGRDYFKISFFLCGANAADIFTMNAPKDGYIEYKRLKTKDKRADEAFMRIKIQPELLPLLEKYKDETGKRAFNFYQRHLQYLSFAKIVNKSLYLIRDDLGIERLCTYSCRHSWATIAYNEVNISKSDVAASLNHSDTKYAVTDFYIKKDFSRIDRANRKVLDYVLYDKKDEV